MPAKGLSHYCEDRIYQLVSEGREMAVGVIMLFFCSLRFSKEPFPQAFFVFSSLPGSPACPLEAGLSYPPPAWAMSWPVLCPWTAPKPHPEFITVEEPCSELTYFPTGPQLSLFNAVQRARQSKELSICRWQSSE